MTIGLGAVRGAAARCDAARARVVARARCRVLRAVAFAAALATGPATAAAEPDLARLPIGDGRLSTGPGRGAVWPCGTRGFGTHPVHGGPWIKRDGTFDFLGKPAAEGEMAHPHVFAVTVAGALRRITGNGLPSHPTAVFPKSPSSPTHRFSPNPHPVLPQPLRWELTALPSLAPTPACVPMGPIGVLLTGAALFNALDANGQDAVAHEIQDRCLGHPERRGLYHYHALTPCLPDEGAGHSALVGWALDGFGIFGRRGEDGRVLTNADLDDCHGHTHGITLDGERRAGYHYHATWEYPYTVGCFRGHPLRLGPPPPPGGRPPGAARPST